MGYFCLFGVLYVWGFFVVVVGWVGLVFLVGFFFFSESVFQTLLFFFFFSFTKVAIKYISYGDLNTCLWLNRQEKKIVFYHCQAVLL